METAWVAKKCDLKRPQFTAELTKELNKILGIKTRLLTLFYL